MHKDNAKTPANVQRALIRLRELHGGWAIRAINAYPRKIADGRLVGLANMWHERSAEMITLLANGVSFSKAEKETEHIYDTCDWGEVPSRLSRGRGDVFHCAAGILRLREQLAGDDKAQNEIRELAHELKDLAVGLVRELADYSVPCVEIGKPIGSEIIEPLNLVGNIRPRKLVGALKACRRYLQKNIHDVPLIPEKLAGTSQSVAPTLSQRARINVELARIHVGTEMILSSEHSWVAAPRKSSSSRDPFGVGKRYASVLAAFQDCLPCTRILATHPRPDADALVSTWMIDRIVFAGQRCRIKFVDRGFETGASDSYDAVLDVGRVFDPARLRFDHKPPALDHRDRSCATRLVWEYLSTIGYQVDHLESLVDLVHDGDAVSRGGSSEALRASRLNGFHAYIEHVRNWSENKKNYQMMYNAIAMWLDATTRPSA